MALGIKGDTLDLNLEYGKQVQPRQKKQKNINDQKGPNTRTFTLHSNDTSQIETTKECDQKKDTYVRFSALGLGFLCWSISFAS
jgi:hypothetical protein